MAVRPAPCALRLNSLLALGLAFGLVGCSTSKTGSASASDASHGTDAKLELNAGQKWVVDKPMMAYIRSMEKAVHDFEGTPGRDHAALAMTIQDDLGRLVTSCTMKGEAHDELHKWLMPFLGFSAEYAKASDPSIQLQKFEEIRNALVVFNAYFE